MVWGIFRNARIYAGSPVLLCIHMITRRWRKQMFSTPRRYKRYAFVLTSDMTSLSLDISAREFEYEPENPEKQRIFFVGFYRHCVSDASKYNENELE